jgi:hypothetical protein
MKSVHVLIAVVVASAALGAVGYAVDGTPARGSLPAVAATNDPSPAPMFQTPEEPTEGTIEGVVLEAIDVPSYTYYRIGAPGSAGTWAAVPSATLVVGDHVRVEGAMKMVDFKSSRLDRVFPEIYFGTLHGGPSAPSAAAASRSGAEPTGSKSAYAPSANPHASYAEPYATGGNPHEGIQSTEPTVDVKPVERASGANARTVAEVIGGRKGLANRLVRVRGTVVKSHSGILGRTYVHLRDGSGDPSKGTNDLVMTTDAAPVVGTVVVLEGTVVLDRDIGAGYTFPTLVENAKLVEVSQ